MLDLAECPGERLLVLGNHDRDVPALRRTGFQKTCRTALCATDPPLVLTHIPLLKVSAGAVNVHGHLHRAAGPTNRHVNVSVEYTDYAPVGLTYVPRACLQTPGTERRHATTGFAVAVGGEELLTVAAAHERRAATRSLATTAGGLVFGMSTTAAAPSATRRARCCGGEPQVAGQRTSVTHVVDGRWCRGARRRDGNASRWNGMPPERRRSRLQEHLRLHAAREYERAKNDPELPNQADVGRQPDVESESVGDFAG